VVSWYCFLGGHWQFIWCIKTNLAAGAEEQHYPRWCWCLWWRFLVHTQSTPHGGLGTLQGLQKVKGSIHMPKSVWWLVVGCPSQQSFVVDQANYQLSPPLDFPNLGLPSGGGFFAFGWFWVVANGVLSGGKLFLENNVSGWKPAPIESSQWTQFVTRQHFVFGWNHDSLTLLQKRAGRVASRFGQACLQKPE
jgi:hypothetical protein